MEYKLMQSKAKKRGGARPGAGRPKKEPTKTIRVPVSRLDEIYKLLKAK